MKTVIKLRPLVNKHGRFAVVLFASMMSGACSTLKPTDDPTRQTAKDPYQKINRAVYSFNASADKRFVRPIARRYKNIVPGGLRKRVSLFFNNLNEPLNAANNLLQGDIHNTLGSSYRFVVNSTIGLLGLFDVAKLHGVQANREDFGQTLASWGVKPGPYIVLPFLGPSNLRDAFGRAIDTAVYYPGDVITDSDGVSVAYTAVNILDTRTNILNFDSIIDAQPDPYSFIKIGFERSRLEAIYDGNAPKNQDNDPDDF